MNKQSKFGKYFCYVVGFGYLGWKLFKAFSVVEPTAINEVTLNLWIVQGLLGAILSVVIGNNIGEDIVWSEQ